MPSDCIITFDHENAVYTSGQNLNGSVRLTTTSKKTIRGIYITVNGYAKVKWGERTISFCNEKKDHFSTAHDQYLNSRTYLVGVEGGASFDLPAGIYDHTFYCHLSASLPTSVTGKYGEIKYEVIVTVDRPFRFDDEFKRGFTVIQELDLTQNIYSKYRLPKTAFKEKDFRCALLCGSGGGTVNIKLHIPFTGYAPGQTIKFSLDVNNESSNDLPRPEVYLEKRITFVARHPKVKEKHSTIKLNHKEFPEVLRNVRKVFDDVLTIPVVPPSSELSNACVLINYAICATVTTNCCYKDIDLTIPIVIGTFPLIENAINPDSAITKQPTAPATVDGVDGTDNLPPGYKIAAPTSYEDAMLALDQSVNENQDDKHQEAPFVPKYPMNHNFAQPPTNSNFQNGHSSENQPSTLTYGWA